MILAMADDLRAGWWFGSFFIIQLHVAFGTYF